jgi:hypothetical protein
MMQSSIRVSRTVLAWRPQPVQHTSSRPNENGIEPIDSGTMAENGNGPATVVSRRSGGGVRNLKPLATSLSSLHHSRHDSHARRPESLPSTSKQKSLHFLLLLSHYPHSHPTPSIPTPPSRGQPSKSWRRSRRGCCCGCCRRCTRRSAWRGSTVRRCCRSRAWCRR